MLASSLGYTYTEAQKSSCIYLKIAKFAVSIILALMSALSTLTTYISGKVLREVKIHTYESPQLSGSTETFMHGWILQEVKGLMCAG